MNKKLIIIWPMIFREFDFYRLEISKISKYFEVEIHEMSSIFEPHLKDIYNPKNICRRKNVKKFKNLFTWYNYLNKIKQINHLVFMINFHINSLDKFLMRLIIYFNKFKTIKFTKSNLPKYTLKKELILYKIKNNFSFSQSLFFLKNFFFDNLSLIFKFDYILAMSYENYLILKKKFNSTTKIIKASSYDYSNALIYKNTKADLKYKNSKFALLLDAPGPRYQGDEKVYKVKHNVSCEKWYPSLNKFFDFLEKTLKIECKIAPHPKTRPPKFSKDFNYRENLFNKLAFSVKKSKVVILRVPGSTAIIYAAMFRKPLIFIYSNEMSKETNFMHSFNLIAKEFKTNLINIDQDYNRLTIRKAFKINIKYYKNYIKKYGTARNDRLPNYLVIKNVLNEIFYKKSFSK